MTTDTGPTLAVLLPDAVTTILAWGLHPFLALGGNGAPGDAGVASEALRRFLAAPRQFADTIFADHLTRLLRKLRISSDDPNVRAWASRLLAGD